MPQHVVAGEEGHSQGMVTTELLHDDATYIDGGLGVAWRMEGASNSKDSSHSTDLDKGQNIPHATDR